MDALPEASATPERPSGMLANNIVHFARTLRTAGLRVGPGQVLRAIEAVEAAGLQKRDDFYWTLHSVFVNRRDQREIFDQAFHVYWRNPRLLEKMMEMLLPSVSVPADPDEKKQLSRRLQEALQPGKGEAPREEEGEPPEVEVEATFTVSDREVLQHRDFEQMSQSEIDEALRAISRLRLPMLGAVPVAEDVLAAMRDPKSGVSESLNSIRTSLMLSSSEGIPKALAVTSPKRIAFLPNVPTVAESGLPGFDMVSWYGLWGPAALPKELGRRLSGEVAKAVRSQLAVERLGDQGFDAVGSTPEEFSAFLQQELVKYTRIVRQANVKVE